MKDYQEIKNNHQKAVNDLLTKHKVFFAFSEKQLIEGMEKIGITDRKELTSIFGGGLLPKSEVKAFLDNMTAVDKQYKKELREAREAKNEAILYELHNHECFYTGEIDEVIKLFDGVFTPFEIKEVFNTNKANQ